MVDSGRNGSTGGSAALPLLTGLAAGAVLGAGIILIVVPVARQALRGELVRALRRARDAASDGYRRASGAANEYVARACEVAEAARAAAAGGVGDVRTHRNASRDPRRSDLAGVDGLTGFADP